MIAKIPLLPLLPVYLTLIRTVRTMKWKLLCIAPFLAAGPSAAQNTPVPVEEAYLKKVVYFLSADSLKGRVNFSRQQLTAARFLYNEFGAAGLMPFTGFNNYLVPFTLRNSSGARTPELRWNGKRISEEHFYFIPSDQEPKVLSLDSFFTVHISGVIPDSVLYHQWNSGENILFQVEPSAGTDFSAMLKNIIIPAYPPKANILVAGIKDTAASLTLNFFGSYPSTPLYNVIGVLPGRSRSKEMIIFSAHYDHVDRDLKGERGEVFNGANDNASGVAAVLALAKHYAARGDNERTLVFCLFAAEELGLLGSAAFSTIIEPQDIKAVINLEMLGRTNASGKNSFFITGEEFSNVRSILAKNLKSDKVKMKWYNDKTNLFARSDNYSFFLRDIPAHSIMCSDDKEPCYHKPCDDADKIDFNHMAEIVRAITVGCATLVNGKDTPVLRKK